MSTSYTYDADKNVVHVTLRGIVTFSDVVDYAENILDDEQVAFGFAECLDMSDMVDMEFSFGGLKAVAAIFERLKKEKGYRGSVIVAPSDLQFGIARMSFALFERFAKLKPVRTMEEAGPKIEELLLADPPTGKSS